MQFEPILLARFWSKVEVKRPSECWPWRAVQDENGYGRFESPHISTCLAHRIAYILFYEAELDASIAICHHCDNPPCCNPKHLWAGNAQENIADAIAKGRFYTGPGKFGTSNGNSRLTEEIVRDIRRRVELGELKVALAREYGASQSTVGSICRRKTWAHVTD